MTYPRPGSCQAGGFPSVQDRRPPCQCPSPSRTRPIQGDSGRGRTKRQVGAYLQAAPGCFGPRKIAISGNCTPSFSRARSAASRLSLCGRLSCSSYLK